MAVFSCLHRALTVVSVIVPAAGTLHGQISISDSDSSNKITLARDLAGGAKPSGENPMAFTGAAPAPAFG